MPPNMKSDVIISDNEEKLVGPQAGPRKYELIYRSIAIVVYLHISALYGLYLCFTAAKWQTILWAYTNVIMAELGATAGAHRLWSHKAYKAKLPLEIILIIFNSLALQNSAFTWVRDHRLHHKYSDTDADPYNATRGFFFSHIGWLLVKKHPEIKKRGKSIEMSDVYSNPVIMIQKRYIFLIGSLICFIIPTLIPMYCWGESLNNAWHVTVLRYVLSFHGIFFINSAAHMWGYKPYDKNIMPSENKFVSIVAIGEGFHNYHHVFPWDYRASELGKMRYNLTAKFIDFFAWIGWAYDLKTVSPEMIEMRSKRTGDITHVWGLDDKDMTEELKAGVVSQYL